MNEQQSEPKCETTLSNLIKVFIGQESWRKGRQFVKGHGGVDQQGPVTSLLKLGQNERLSEICHDLPERQRLHGALSGSSGSSNWIVTIRLTSIFPMYLRDIVVLENSRKSRRFAIEPGRIGQIPHPPSFFSPSSRGSRAVGKG